MGHDVTCLSVLYQFFCEINIYFLHFKLIDNLVKNRSLFKPKNSKSVQMFHYRKQIFDMVTITLYVISCMALVRPLLASCLWTGGKGLSVYNNGA